MRHVCRDIRRNGGGDNDGEQRSVVFWQLCGAWVLILLVTGVWLRVTVAYAVHSSIQYNVQMCGTLIANHDVALVVGFSWGGAVAAELLAQQQAQGAHTTGNNTSATTISTHRIVDSHSLIPASVQEEEDVNNKMCGISFVLLAPTTAVVARLDVFQPVDAALRVAAARRRGVGAAAVVAVVHATQDPVFCPHAERWRGRPGIEFTTLRDNHVFLRSSSERALKEIVHRILVNQQLQT